MQGFQVKIQLMGMLLILGVACRPEKTGPSSLPTPIIATRSFSFSTPTLYASQVSNSAQPTPLITPGASMASDLSIGDSYIPELGNSGYDVQKYTLQLALNPGVAWVEGKATIEAVATEDNLRQLSFDFVGYEIVQLTVDGVPASFSQESRKLLIALPHSLLAGTLFTTVVTYAGQPTREASPFIGYTDAWGLDCAGPDNIYALSEPDGARYWFPANDHPRDKAFFRFELTVPVELTAVANGQLIDIQMSDVVTVPGGEPGRTFIWEHSHPMATYLALVAVGPFERIESVSPGGIPLRHYVTAEFRDEFETAVLIAGEAIDWMSQQFGAYPFEAFGFVAADLPPTAMETQTMVILSTDLIGQRTFIHELAHMWFGNWVSPNSWSEMWRKEGFATYIGLMWETRDDPEELDRQMANVTSSVAQNTPQFAIGNPPPEHLMSYNTYFKGAAFIHSLRREMGDESFFAGVRALRAYLQRYGGRTASDAQFQAVMEEAAGRSMDALFVEWLN
jgi:aminopeptidase N